jgi:exodeoxyribonuclease-5
MNLDLEHSPSLDQDNAIKAAVDWFLSQSSFGFWLAGPAGSGKTSIAKALAQKAKKPIFAAPTGRAAMQLTKRGCPAKTLHQLLYKPITVDGKVEFFFAPEEDHPLWSCDLLIIDEVSMVSDEHAGHLLHFQVPILMIGDPYQLPPVSGGALTAGQKPDFLLTEIHRQAVDNPVLQLATRVRQGRGLPPGTVRTVGNLQDAIRCLEDLKSKHDTDSTMLLAGARKTVRELNVLSRKGAPESNLLKRGEPVLCLKNDHKVGMMNGSIWTSKVAVSKDDIDFNEKMKRIYPVGLDLLSNDFADHEIQDVKVNVLSMLGMDEEEGWKSSGIPCDYGHARTVHKAQGDEADVGVFINEAYMFKGLVKELLYTALTRFRKAVTIVQPK